MRLQNDDYFQACVDVGHANMFSYVDKDITPGNMVRTLGEHVKCFHIHDNDGFKDLHETPFTMSLDWDDLVKAINEINYQGDLDIEIYCRKTETEEDMINKVKTQLIVGRKLIQMIESAR